MLCSFVSSVFVIVWFWLSLLLMIWMLIGVGSLKLRIWLMMLVGRNVNVMLGNVCVSMLCSFVMYVVVDV